MSRAKDFAHMMLLQLVVLQKVESESESCSNDGVKKNLFVHYK